MHPVTLSDGEVALVKQAKAEHNWRILPTYKLKYLYQRLVALPGNDLQSVRDIAKEAAVARGKLIVSEKQADDAYAKEAEKIFGME